MTIPISKNHELSLQQFTTPFQSSYALQKRILPLFHRIVEIGGGRGRDLLSTTESFSDSYVVNNIPSTIYANYFCLKQVTTWLQPQYLNVCIPIKHKAVSTLEYFITYVEFCLSYFNKALWSSAWIFFNFHLAKQNCVCFEWIYHQWPFEYRVFCSSQTKLNNSYFFLKILKKYYQLPTLVILNISGYIHQNCNANL